MEGEDTQEIKRLSDELTQTSHKIAEMMYSRASQQQAHAGPGAGGPQAGASTKKDEDVVDADFEEVKK
jgi:molecular chaperone DnaK